MKMSQLKTENKYVPFGNTKRKSTSHKQSKISSTEYQKVKKRKDFNASDWKWDGDQDLYVREEMNEAGGHYTQPVYDMIEKYGIEIVMHGLLSVLDADVIQDALGRMGEGLGEESIKTNEWVQEPHEGQKWTGQEINFIQDLCKRHDGIQMQWPKPQTGADGIKGPSPLWDKGNIMSNDADLQKLMSWVEQNKHDVESYFRSDFRVYSKDENGKQGQSDGNQILSNINAKIAGKSLELSEFGPAERYIRTGNTIHTANSRTGSVRSTMSLGGDKTATVNNHFNADGSQGQVKASGTVNGVKFKASNNITGTAPKASASARGITINASKKVREETEYSDKQIKMAFGILNDPRYRDGNYDGAYATIEKVAKGLARHPSVRNALKRANESVNKYK